MSPGSRAAAAVLLAAAVVVPLLVVVYDREDPTLFGFPFFYWFQFVLIPFASAATYAAFRLVTPNRTASGKRRPPNGGDHR